jgi:hypothetical protein
MEVGPTLVSALCAIVQGEQFVPVTRISEFEVFIAVPLTLKLNCCPATAGLGFVLKVVMEGVAEYTLKDSDEDGVPEPFCTATP